jgi:hypothetical protein
MEAALDDMGPMYHEENRELPARFGSARRPNGLSVRGTDGLAFDIPAEPPS